MSTKKKLCSIKGLSEAKVEKIKEVTVKLSGVLDNVFIVSLFMVYNHMCFVLLYLAFIFNKFMHVNIISFNSCCDNKNNYNIYIVLPSETVVHQSNSCSITVV